MAPAPTTIPLCSCGTLPPSRPLCQALLRALGLIDADLSEANATLCFAWSRTAVVDDATPKGHLRETHLTREGFFEALCRVAVLKVGARLSFYLPLKSSLMDLVRTCTCTCACTS